MKHRRLGGFCNRKLSLTIQAEVLYGGWAGLVLSQASGEGSIGPLLGL